MPEVQKTTTTITMFGQQSKTATRLLDAIASTTLLDRVVEETEAPSRRKTKYVVPGQIACAREGCSVRLRPCQPYTKISIVEDWED